MVLFFLACGEEIASCCYRGDKDTKKEQERVSSDQKDKIVNIEKKVEQLHTMRESLRYLAGNVVIYDDRYLDRPFPFLQDKDSGKAPPKTVEHIRTKPIKRRWSLW